MRSGEASAEELVEAAIGRVEELNPRAQRRHPSAVRGGSRGGAGRAARRARSPGFRSCSRTWAPPSRGSRFISVCRRSRTPTSGRRSTPTSPQRFRHAGFVTIGKTNTARAGHPADDRAAGLRRRPATHGTSSAAPAARAAAPRRLSRRAWCRSRTPTTAAARSASRPAACGLVGLKPTRQRISEGPMIGDLMSGLTGGARGVAKRSRHRRGARGGPAGPAPGDPYVGARARAPLHGGAPAPSPGRSDRAHDADAAGSRPTRVVVDAARDAGGCSSRSGTRSSRAGRRASTGFDLPETFLTRWRAGQAASLAQFGVRWGASSATGDAEPLTLALAEQGRSQSRASTSRRSASTRR